nr:2OG-Fe(II) oxygenase family protein [Lentibacter algarum]
MDFAALTSGDVTAREVLRRGVLETGFLQVVNTSVDKPEIDAIISAYRSFFKLPVESKQQVNMALTGSNRGWGAGGSERVDPKANPDYKEVFDCGYQLPDGDALSDSGLLVYGENLWPEMPVGFAQTVQDYYGKAISLCREILAEIAGIIGRDATFFDDKFSSPMALLRGNYYPARPDWAGDKDFGIAAHSDYGCLTLLTGDGTAGLEVKAANGEWHAVEVRPGEFVINFGEMLQMWSGGAVKATLHRVVGTGDERISVPMFFNPNYDTDVSAEGQAPVSAGDYLTKRYDETYLHLQKGKG